MRRLKFILPFAAAALTLAVVTAASARPERAASLGVAAKISCKSTDQARFRHAR